MQWFLILPEAQSVQLKQILWYEKPGIDHENQQISVTKPLVETQWTPADTFKSTEALRKHETMLHFHLTRFPSKPSRGNATEFWTIGFPQHFRIAETPYFTLWINWNTNNKLPFTANSRALFARTPNLGNKENRVCSLGLKTWPS